MRRVAGHIVAAFLLLSACNSGQDAAGPVIDERTPVPQEVTERVFGDGTFEIIDTLHVDDPTFTPAGMTVLEDGDLLINDKGSYQLLRIDPETGEIVTRYGSGAGSGPGEHLAVVGIGEFDSGQVWSFDQRNIAVNVFDADGRLDRRIALEDRAHFLTAHAVDRLIGVNPTIEEPFRFYDSDGRIVKKFGWLLDEPGAESLPFIGFVMPIEAGGFMYLTQLADLMKAYDSDGALMWFRQLIDRREPLDIEPTDNGSIGLDYPDDGDVISRMPLNTWGERIHLIVVGHSKDWFLVDTYDASDGDYVASLRFQMEDQCGPRVMTDTTVWMVCDGLTIVRARIPEL